VSGPSPDWMQQLGAQLSMATAPPGTAVAPLPPAPPPPPMPVAGAGPSISWLSKGAPFLDAPQAPANDPFGLMAPQQAAPATQAPAQAAPPGEVTPVDPRLMPPTGVDPNAVPTPAPQQQVAAQAPADVQFLAAGGGVRPAGEADIRGPRQNQHLMQSFEAPLAVADQMGLRSAMAAQREADEYAIQADQAMQREEAAQKVALQRQAQMERLSMDYEDSVQQLGQMKLDDNRWWANKSTPDKIGTAILAFVGGLAVFDPKGDGRNLAYEAIMREADRDIEAQKFDYMVKGEQAKGAHNAFAMAMDRYRNEDAAMGVARAAAIDYSLARLGKVQAEWKGVESQNAADELRAKLLSERERTIAAGIQFVPAKAVGGGYRMVVRGQVIPGIVSEKDAQRIALEHGVKPAEETDKILTQGGVNVAIEDQKANHAAAKGQKELSVRLPNGEIVVAPTAPEHKELTDLSASVQETRRLVARAKELREEGFRTNPGNLGELRSIQQQLRVQAGVQGKLGALAAEDLKIVDGEIGQLSDPLTVSSAPDRALQAWLEKSNAMIKQRVGTYATASPTARGDLSGAKSLQFRGK
jgi:hypothetical protein